MNRILLFLTFLISFSIFSNTKNIYNDTLRTEPVIKTRFSKLDAQIAFNEAFNKSDKVSFIQPIHDDIEKYRTSNWNQLLSSVLNSSKQEKFTDKLKKLFNSKNLKYLENLTKSELVKLPVGLKGFTNDGFKAEMVIVNAKVTSEYLELTAFARLETQFLDTHLYFAAEGLKLSHDGGVIGDWKLYSLGNTTLPQLGNKALLTVIGGDLEKKDGSIKGDSYIQFDCNGFKSFSFKIDIRLARSIVVPVDDSGKRIEHTNDLDTDKEKAVGNSKYLGAVIGLQANGWNDMLIKLDLPAFEVAKLKNWGFKIKDVIIDLSDSKNDPSLDTKFPKSYYTYNLFPNENKNVWRGFFAKEVEITMPKQFNDKKTNERTIIKSTDLLIDGFGVSGTFAGYKLLDKGSATGWQYKIDYVGIGLELGRIRAAKIVGAIKPSATNAFLEITGSFNEQKYLFQAAVTESDFKMFKGRMIFEKNSWVKLELDNEENEFKASAFLNGKLSLKGALKNKSEEVSPTRNVGQVNSYDDTIKEMNQSIDNGGTKVLNKALNYWNTNFSFVGENTKESGVEQLKKYVDLGVDEVKIFLKKQADSFLTEIENEKVNQVTSDLQKKDEDFYNFKGIVFQNLKLQSFALPYVEASYFGYPSNVGQDFGNFNVSFSDIKLITPSKDILGLAFKMKVNLMEGKSSTSDNSGFITAEAGLRILGKFSDETFHSYKFKGVEIDEINIDIEKSGFALKGGLRVFEDDPIYGKGFQGDLAIELKKLDVRGMAKGMFAKKDFSYWFVDFQIDNNGSRGKFGLERIEGGLSYHMKRIDGNMKASIGSNVFQPDTDSGLGFRAGVKVKFGESSSFKAKVFLEMQYNNNGGLNRIYFLGEGAMMAKDGNTEGNLRDTWASYDTIFSGGEANQMNEYLSKGNMLEISKRKHPVSEVAKDGKIGVFVSVEKDFKNDSFDGLFELYLNLEGIKGSGANNKFGMVHMYSSPNKNYLHVGTPTDKLGAIFKIGMYDINVGAYFMTGDVIPSQVPPHPRVLEILGPDIMNDNRNLSLLNDAKGFAFGLNFSVAIGYDAGWFYAFLEAGGGFDITHRKLTGVRCAGRPGLVGNDGWYSMGQVYAYIYGEAGLRIKVFGFRKDIKILAVGVAAMLRGEFPNPTHMEGYIGVYYNVLGGLIKGRFRYKAEIGEKCEFVGMSNPLSTPLISSFSPDGEENVDVFKKPQVAFNYGMLQPFSAEDADGNRKTVRINLKKYDLKVNNVPLNGEWQWQDNNSKVNFVSFEVLPPQKEIVAEIEVGVEQQSGGTWIPLQGGDGTATEKRTFSFKTGNAPEYIPLENVAYSYPVANTNNFYPNEHKTVYVKLKQGQKYLFDGSVKNWILKGEIRQGEKIKHAASLNYNSEIKKVSFNYDNVSTSGNYELKLMAYVPGSENAATASIDITQNSGSATNVTGNDTNYNSVQTISNNTATAQNNKDANKSLLEYKFTTSKHNTFVEKMNSIKTKEDFFIPYTADTHKIQTATNIYEIFNEAELYGNQYTNGKPLITVEAVLEDDYFKEIINPLVYQNYPLESGLFSIKNRVINELGVPPIKAIDIINYYRMEMNINPTSIYINQRFPYEYSIAKIYKQDFLSIRNQLVNKYLATPVNWEKYSKYKYVIDEIFPLLKIGEYKIRLRYGLNENEFRSVIEKKYERKY
ncbi:hypothetical protein [Flavobacterium oreochromis]|uniref:Uncharacterized protein n=1 Tax=Flavobacterium columnare TaxID=996 RepID=A0A246G8U0_9FLAO|nr:hypothetical protein [Flavobacterium oreochromis]OWP75481.1 hypothetical protein BWK62_11985 [Flavobacterium oreochromis]